MDVGKKQLPDGFFTRKSEIYAKKGLVTAMELNAVRELVCMYREVFCGTSEQPVDLDIALPDYCPDISRILKCQAVPQVTSRSLAGERLTVEGSTIIRVFYGDEEGILRCCELSSAFSADFNLRMQPEQPAVFTDIRVDFMNCRAVTKRRVDIHCAFTVTAHVWGQQRQELLTAARGCGVHTKNMELPVCCHIATVQQPISLTEEFMPESGRAAPETILRFSAEGRVHESKAVAGKMMVKGEVQVHVLYETDAVAGAVETVSYAIPFSQILDIDGLDPECICTTRLELLSVQVQLNEMDSTNGAAFEAEIRGAVCVTACKQQMLPVILDAYSTDCHCELVEETVSLWNNDTSIECMMDAHGTLSDCELATVVDAWHDLRNFTTAVKDGRLHWNGRLGVSLLLKDENGQAAYQETMLDMTDSVPWNGEEVQLDPRISVNSMAYRLNGAGALEIRAQVQLHSPVQTVQKHHIVKDIIPDLQRPKVKDPSCMMTLYYAEPGESVWRIASRYNTTEEAIRNENDLKSETIETAGMLFIPAV